MISILETTVLTMSNEECIEWLNFNNTDTVKKRRIKHTFPSGINEQILCSRGIRDLKTGIISVSFKKCI